MLLVLDVLGGDKEDFEISFEISLVCLTFLDDDINFFSGSEDEDDEDDDDDD